MLGLVRPIQRKDEGDAEVFCAEAIVDVPREKRGRRARGEASAGIEGGGPKGLKREMVGALKGGCL